MAVNIRLFVLIGLFGACLHQPAIGQGVAPVTSTRGSNQGGVSEQMEQGLIRPDAGAVSPIDNILGSGIRLPPPQETNVQIIPAPMAPAANAEPVAPASKEPPPGSGQ